MRVLMITQSFYDFDGRILRQTAALTKNNIDVEVICLNLGNFPKYNKVENVNVYRIMKKFPQDKFFHYIFFSVAFLIKSFVITFKLLFKNKPDIVQVHNMPDYLVFAAIFHKFAGVPVVLDMHDLTVELFKEKWGERKFKYLRPVLVAVEKMCVKFSDKVITVSDQCGEKLMERGLPEDKLTIVMNVADSQSFPYYKNRNFNKIESGLKLFYHGTFAERYGLHNTLYALPDVVKRIPSTVFYIVGKFENEYGNYLKKLAIELNIADNVSFNHPIPYEKVGEELKFVDIGIITETVFEYTNLGIPTKAFEYAATGLPFAINDIEINRSVFRNESVAFIHHNNKKQIASELINLCLNPERRKKMSLNAYADVMKVSDEVMRERYLDLMKSLSTNHKSSIVGKFKLR
ncbi:MAG: glycosyltransferase family 4 protein [Ignavibacteria bacterium]|nr:glycosyltransferase family 4 protein [Ignavibacteria bacterium]